MSRPCRAVSGAGGGRPVLASCQARHAHRRCSRTVRRGRGGRGPLVVRPVRAARGATVACRVPLRPSFAYQESQDWTPRAVAGGDTSDLLYLQQGEGAPMWWMRHDHAVGCFGGGTHCTCLDFLKASAPATAGGGGSGGDGERGQRLTHERWGLVVGAGRVRAERDQRLRLQPARPRCARAWRLPCVPPGPWYSAEVGAGLRVLARVVCVFTGCSAGAASFRSSHEVSWGRRCSKITGSSANWHAT